MPEALRLMKANELLEIERVKQREAQEEEDEELRIEQDEAEANGEIRNSDKGEESD